MYCNVQKKYYFWNTSSGIPYDKNLFYYTKKLIKRKKLY